MKKHMPARAPAQRETSTCTRTTSNTHTHVCVRTYGCTYTHTRNNTTCAHHAPQALPHVRQVAAEGQDGHDLTGHADVKACGVAHVVEMGWLCCWLLHCGARPQQVWYGCGMAGQPLVAWTLVRPLEATAAESPPSSQCCGHPQLFGVKAWAAAGASSPVLRSWPRSSVPWPTVMPRRNLRLCWG
jgi:hypothetical protein